MSNNSPAHQGTPMTGGEINVPIAELEFLHCPVCKCPMFSEVFKLGRVSKLHPKNPTGKDQIIKLEIPNTTSCKICGEGFGERREKDGNKTIPKDPDPGKAPDPEGA